MRHSIHVPLSIALLLAAGCVKHSTPESLPADWKPYPSELTYEIAPPDCPAGKDALSQWSVYLEGNTVRARPASAAGLGPHIDTVPYPIDYASVWDKRDQVPDPVPQAEGGDTPDRDAKWKAWALLIATRLADTHVLRIDDGWLIGIDGGGYELTGSLWWYPDRPGPGRKLISGAIRALHRVSATTVLAVVRLQASRDYQPDGDIFVVERDQTDRWNAQPRAHIGFYPRIIVPEPRLLILASDAIFQVEVSGTLRPLAVFKQAMPIAFASVLFAPSGNIYVGFRYFVLQLAPLPRGGYQQNWFAPPCPAGRRATG